MQDKLPFKVNFERSRDSWMYDDITKKEYLDCFTSHAAMPIGWNHPDFDYKRFKHILFHNISNSDLLSEPYEDFVKQFKEFTPDFKHHFFIAGGTLGVENALKAAFDYKSQKIGLLHENHINVIHFTKAFHGRSGYTLSLTNTTPDKTDRFPKFQWTRIESPTLPNNDIEILELNALNKIKQTIENTNVAAVLLEPIQGEGGDRHFRKSFMVNLRELTKENDVMLICDEVQTGMGMTGKTWCYEHLGIIPDMISFGKKVQVCGFCSTGKIDEVKNNVFTVPGRINSTWGGNLVDMVRSTIFMEIIKKHNLINNAAKVGKYFYDALATLKLKNLRGQGLMLSFDVDNRDEVYNKLLKRMICLKGGQNSIRLRPALTFSENDVDIAQDIIAEAV